MSTGKPLPHDAAQFHVTGTARYVDDIPMPTGTLHLAFGLSTVARGAITAMRLEKTKSAAGVVGVLTADDLPFANDVFPSAHDEPLLATSTTSASLCFWSLPQATLPRAALPVWQMSRSPLKPRSSP